MYKNYVFNRTVPSAYDESKWERQECFISCQEGMLQDYLSVAEKKTKYYVRTLVCNIDLIEN
jgi:hypothetical protein